MQTLVPRSVLGACALLIASCAHGTSTQEPPDARVAQEQAATAPEVKLSAAPALQRSDADLDMLRARAALRQSQLSTFQAARQAQRRRSAEAAAMLTRFAGVKQDERGTVITLAGESMFQAGETELLPTAQAKLREVARILTEQDPNSILLIEGHTDTRGSEAYNTNLSQQRADKVGDYLTRHGVAADRIRCDGRGPREPVAENRTFEGRAANRRVEIVLAPSMQPAANERAASKTATARVDE